ncbi:unnamed protein product [Allacma fusca]|uniref:Uncharacterized protein n=1 Tax=Allacma fusca TaxID=39272 RepID=A0A8J2PNM5_9HEXA|nr:unnamed protein product [Allacma fusca]
MKVMETAAVPSINGFFHFAPPNLSDTVWYSGVALINEMNSENTLTNDEKRKTALENIRAKFEISLILSRIKDDGKFSAK